MVGLDYPTSPPTAVSVKRPHTRPDFQQTDTSPVHPCTADVRLRTVCKTKIPLNKLFKGIL